MGCCCSSSCCSACTDQLCVSCSLQVSKLKVLATTNAGVNLFVSEDWLRRRSRGDSICELCKIWERIMCIIAIPGKNHTVVCVCVCVCVYLSATVAFALDSQMPASKLKACTMWKLCNHSINLYSCCSWLVAQGLSRICCCRCWLTCVFGCEGLWMMMMMMMMG
jgi:hypothetical protein